MVGRMGDESVVIRAEKGKLRGDIDREKDGEGGEVVFAGDREGGRDLLPA